MIEHETWYNKLWLTLEWQVQNPDKSLSSDVVYKDVKIGSFYKLVRNIYFNGSKKSDGKIYYYGNVLTSEQQKMLEESKIFEHSKNVKFEKEYKSLLEYALNNKTLHGYESSWLKKIRKIYNNGNLMDNGSIVLDEKNMLLKYQVEKLEKLNCYLDDFYTFNDSTWDRNFNILFKYLDIYGSFPTGHMKYEGVDIVYWSYLQRTIYFNGIEDEYGNIVLKTSGRERTLTKRQILKLKGIGLFDKAKKSKIDRNDLWNDLYIKLCLRLKEDSSLINREKKETDTVQDKYLLDWLYAQRIIFKFGKVLPNGDIKYNSSILSKEQIVSLEELGIKWYLDDELFERITITPNNQYQLKRELINRLCFDDKMM
ncbi:MAG: hypothetical protein E7158_00020 [Firmicutes bacterium]|nr:hypothetical protein [Bacillota bacterium]